MSAARAIRSGGRGWAWFYPLGILIAAGLILFSLGPAPFAARGGAVTATATDGGLMLGPASLSQSTPDVWHAVHIVRAAAGAPIGLRIAVKPGAPDSAEGVRLALGAATAQALAQKTVAARVQFKRIAETGAVGFSLKLGAGGVWQMAPLPAPNMDQDSGPPIARPLESIDLLLPATPDASTLFLRAHSSRGDFASGVEVQQIVLTPQP